VQFQLDASREGNLIEGDSMANESDEHQRSVLPPPDPAFRREIEVAFDDSKNKASYRPGTVRIPEDAVINIKNRLFTLTAELENPDGNAEGILVTVGGETGGYALIVQNAKPTFHYNWLGRERYTIASTEPLPNGLCTIRFDFAYDGGGAGKGGTGTLSVNDNQVAEGRIDKTVPVVFSTDDTFDVGADWARRSLRPTNHRSTSPAP
jgi:hypothetical protein